MIKNENVFSTGQPFPPKEERSRLEDYNSAVNLFEAKHELVFELPETLDQTVAVSHAW
jgi:hypothetical protein